MVTFEIRIVIGIIRAILVIGMARRMMTPIRGPNSLVWTTVRKKKEIERPMTIVKPVVIIRNITTFG